MADQKMKSHASVTLIPWDPTSEAHVERLYQQRLACGWKEDQVGKWKELQADGTIALQWVTISSTDLTQRETLDKHTARYPLQTPPLEDSATVFGNSPREPTHASFLPVGHISLNSTYEDPDLIPTVGGQYFISNFWISEALQGSGLGRASMDQVELMAIEEPLNAKTLVLSTVDGHENREERERKWAALGVAAPKVDNQSWYERRGYEVFDKRKKLWKQTDKEGKLWWTDAVFMRKHISGAGAEDVMRTEDDDHEHKRAPELPLAISKQQL